LSKDFIISTKSFTFITNKQHSMQKTNIAKDSLLESMAAIFNHSYSGPMVGKNEGEYLNWSELSDPEKDLISKEKYDSVVSIYAANTNRKKSANTVLSVATIILSATLGTNILWAMMFIIGTIG